MFSLSYVTGEKAGTIYYHHLQFREVRHKRSGNWSWLWHRESRKGTHSSWTLTLSTCYWVRDRASAGSSACRPTHRLQLFPPLTTAVGEKWGSVLVIIAWSWKWGGLTHEQDLIISLYIPFFWLWSSQEWESIIWVHEKAPVPRLSINPIYNIANAFEVCMSGAI